MRRGHVMLLLGLALALSGANVGAASAQTADPITGMWTGTLGNDTRKSAVSVIFKSDAKVGVTGEVTGSGLVPGDIKSGSYDAKSGAFKFLVVLRGDRDAGTQITFEGTLGTDTATVNAKDPTGNVFTMAIGRRSKVVQTLRAANEVRVDPGVSAAKRGFAEVSGWVTRAAELVPPDKYSYRPAPTVRTFAELIGHVTDGNNYYCGRAAGKNSQWSDATEKGGGGKAVLTAKLKQAFDACNPAYESGQVSPLIENVAHTSLHYGNIITYMRMMGLTPPSS